MRRRRGATHAWLTTALLLGAGGCALAPVRAPFQRTTPVRDADNDNEVVPASHDEPVAIAAAIPGELAGPQPVDVFIRRALEENRTVRAARSNVLALKHRIAQVTSLDDPSLSNTIFPVPAVAPQFSLMGYMPYDALLAQQFPWCGTLKLRGQAAEDDVRVALFELAAAQLDVVAAVKRAYYDLELNQKSGEILAENRRLAEEFLSVARERYRTGTATQTDVLRSEVAVSDIDREREAVDQGIAEARADLAKQLHVDPETELTALPTTPDADAPAAVERLYRLAAASRPELRGRLAAVARDEKAVELARKKYYPNVTLGLVYQDMQKHNAVTPLSASGVPNVGLFVGFNLPVYRKRIAAGVCEAQARASADAQLYEAERDQVFREVKELMTRVKVQRNVGRLLRESNLPRSRQILEATASDYRAGNVDYLGLVSAWRDVLQVELQIAQVDAELGKALASLERAVGAQINEHPPAPAIKP